MLLNLHKIAIQMKSTAYILNYAKNPLLKYIRKKSYFLVNVQGGLEKPHKVLHTIFSNHSL